MDDKIVKIYSGGDLIINRIKQELEAQGIASMIKDGFKQGIQAGFAGGVPSAVELFVVKGDLENALEIVKVITEE